VRAHEGFLTISCHDGIGFESRLAVLDPASRLLIFFSGAGKVAGTEVAAVDMVGAVVHREAPPGAPQARAGGFAFWLAYEDSGVYGALPRGGGASPPTACVARTAEDRDAWVAALTAAGDHATMEHAEPHPPTDTLLHYMKGASFFSSVAGAAERRVELHAADRHVLIYADQRGAALAAILRLEAPGTHVHFAADAPGEKAPKGWSPLRLEITARSTTDDKLSLHVFRARDWKAFCGWAAALAAL